MIVRFSILVFFAVLLTVSDAAAEKHEQPDKPKTIEGYIPIQLPSFSVPVISPGGWLGRGTISMFLIVRGQKKVETFCRYMPRVREAITLTVDQNPVTIRKNKYQLEKTGALLQQAINEALPEPLVIKLHLLAGALSMGQDAVDLELPGTNSTCMALKEIPERIEAILRGEGPQAKTSLAPGPKKNPKPAPALPTSEVRIIPQLLPPGSVPSRGAPASSEAGKTGVPEWKSNAKGQKFQDPKSCRKLKTVWGSGFHKAGARTYWLSRVFTLDDDNDGAVDNVGFILKSEDRPDLSIYYFPGQGRQSVITVPTLRLKDDRDVLAICFGQEEFKKPEKRKDRAIAPFKVPNLAIEIITKGEKTKDQAKAAQEPENSFSSGIGLIFAIAVGAGILLILGGGISYILARRRSERRRKERRKKKGRRRGKDRRKSQKPQKGEERRKDEDRRSEGERREDNDRRKEKDRSG